MNREMRRRLAKLGKGGNMIVDNRGNVLPPNMGQNKVKILAYMDSPTVATGFGTVSRNILSMLYATGKYDITVFGINHWGDPHNFPFGIYPAGINQDQDPYGRKKFCNFAMNADFDILFLLQDTFILDFLPELLPALKKKRIDKPFKSILYFPIDGVPKVEWIYNISFCDKLVAYAEFGKKAASDMLDIIRELHNSNAPAHPILRMGKDIKHVGVESFDVIFHGVDDKSFFVLPENDNKRFRAEYFKEHANKFIFTNVNRNQQRKDIPRTVNAFRIFHDRFPDTLLYLHMAEKDFGWYIPQLVNAFGLRYGVDVITPKDFGPNKGYPIELVNRIYNASDCFVSTTLGEGMGLCLHPDTNVYTERGVTSIKDIVVGDKVLSDDGTYNKVEGVLTREHHGTVINIKTQASETPICSSVEHGFLTLVDGNRVWKGAGELILGDHLVFPRRCMGEDTLKLKSFGQTEDYLLFPIIELSKSNYSGVLVDLQVAKTNNFISENVVVHNSWLEAMVTKRPVIVPHNTAMAEFITPDLGWTVKSGTSPSLLTVIPNDNEVVRPMVDVEDMLEKMAEVYLNKEKVRTVTENAYRWAKSEMLWTGKIKDKWIALFDKTSKELQDHTRKDNSGTSSIIDAEIF